MHHGVRVRVFFRRSLAHHSRNDSSSSTSWSHVHVFSHIQTRYFSEGSVQQHPPPCSFRKIVRIKDKTPIRTNQQYVVQQQQQQQQQQQRHPQQKQAAPAAEAPAAEASSTSSSSSSSSSRKAETAARCRKHERTSAYTAVRDFSVQFLKTKKPYLVPPTFSTPRLPNIRPT